MIAKIAKGERMEAIKNSQGIGEPLQRTVILPEGVVLAGNDRGITQAEDGYPTNATLPAEPVKTATSTASPTSVRIYSIGTAPADSGIRWETGSKGQHRPSIPKCASMCPALRRSRIQTTPSKSRRSRAAKTSASSVYLHRGRN